jgi:hypothetical protein
VCSLGGSPRESSVPLGVMRAGVPRQDALYHQQHFITRPISALQCGVYTWMAGVLDDQHDDV